jgi:hypothetical protein
MDLKKSENTVTEERNQRMRMVTALQSNSQKLQEIEDRLRRTEEHSTENKNALTQLISHTKNVERAVNMGQQEILAKKDSQTQK